MADKYKFNTRAIHGNTGKFTDNATTAPIIQSSAFEYDKAEDIQDVFTGKQFGYVYGRIGNPTVNALEQRINFLEGSLGSIAVASGMAAITISLLNILKSGDHIVAGQSLFGGTFSLFQNNFSQFDIDVSYADATDLEAIKKVIKPNTKVIYAETIGNPKMDVVNVQALADIAHENNIPFFLDNTIPSPYLLKGKEHDVDVIIHSTTKFINGTGNSIGGVIIDTGNYTWNEEKFPVLKKYIEKFGQFSYLARARKSTYRDFGSCLSPFNAFLILNGIETLGLRMEKHCENAIKLAEFLDSHPKVKWVNFSGLKNSPFHDLAKKQFNNKYCSMLSFGLGTKEKAFKLINHLDFIKNMTNLGDVRTLILHPASTICADFSDEEKDLMGVTEDLMRISVGIEDIDDIIEDFSKALAEVE